MLINLDKKTDSFSYIIELKNNKRKRARTRTTQTISNPAPDACEDKEIGISLGSYSRKEPEKTGEKPMNYKKLITEVKYVRYYVLLF